MELKNLILTIENKLAIITVHRPTFSNALNTETLKEIKKVFLDILPNEKIGAVIITGEEKSFVSGADIKEMINMTSEQSRQFSQLGQQAFFLVESFNVPVLAAVNGFALGGGCELAMACDIRIASEKAKFGQPEVRLGLIPGFGGTQRLVRLVGFAKAKELLFSGDPITAQEALQIGLVNAVYSDEVFFEKTKELAQKFISRGPLAIMYCKQAIHAANDIVYKENAVETSLFGLTFATEDSKEGMRSFLEKRSPIFLGK